MHVSLFHIQGSSVEGFLTDFFTDKLPQPQRWEDALKFFKIPRYDTGFRRVGRTHGRAEAWRANCVQRPSKCGASGSEFGKQKFHCKNSGTCR